MLASLFRLEVARLLNPKIAVVQNGRLGVVDLSMHKLRIDSFSSYQK